MAPKRPVPAEQPPPAESSDEEETSDESGEEEEFSDNDEPKSTQQKAAPTPCVNPNPQRSAPSSDSESESEPDEPKGKAPQASRLTVPATSKPQKSAPSDSEEDESESDSDITPVAAKPMEVQSTPQSKVLSLKRPAADDAAKISSKKSSNPASRGGSTATGEESSRKLFQRVWNDEDEISLLEGMIEFWEVRGIDPSTNIMSFHEFIKERLRLDAVPGQLVNKIRNFKKKFKNYEAKGRPVIKPNEQRSIELCKKLWGSENGIIREAPSAKANGTTAKKKKTNAGNSSAAVAGPLSPERRIKEEAAWHSDATLMGLCEGKLSRFSSGHLDELFVRRGLDLVSKPKREELEQRWKKLQMAELQVVSERALIIHQQTKLILDAYNRSE